MLQNDINRNSKLKRVSKIWYSEKKTFLRTKHPDFTLSHPKSSSNRTYQYFQCCYKYLHSKHTFFMKRFTALIFSTLQNKNKARVWIEHWSSLKFSIYKTCKISFRKLLWLYDRIREVSPSKSFRIGWDRRTDSTFFCIKKTLKAMPPTITVNT